MILARTIRQPSDEELQESIMEEDFPQYHSHDGELYPRSSGILKLHPQSLHNKLHFGEYDSYFLEHVRRTAAEGINIHNGIRNGIFRLLKEGILASGFEIPNPESNRPDTTPLTLNETEKIKIRRCLSWLHHRKPVILHPPEQTIVHPDLGYGGSPDLVCRLPNRVNGSVKNGKNFVIDFKTGQDVQDVHWLQVESYARLVEMQTGLKIDMLGILILGKTGKNAELLTASTEERRRHHFKYYLREWQRLFPEPFLSRFSPVELHPDTHN